MSEEVLAATAEYVLKNRENGWLKYALQVLAAGPHIRNALIRELCADLEKALKREKRLGYDLEVERSDTDDPDGWFSVDVTREGVWDELGVSLGNWKRDASEVAFGVYNYGAKLNEAASEQIRECLSSKNRAWPSKRYPQWIWNVFSGQVNWNDPLFLMRVASEREIVVSELANSMVEVIELVDEALTDARKPRRKREV
ncbi:MAG: hypothetical protein F4X81_12235 [Gammaproteobacteria bacterium]|nr:hypothetical protein [Gammaproteobacteria bacterium]MYE52223.1 hypothetical protein [Gammaproteobacteria bacterium]MYF49320.1 hypothetical protein [Gammaproteobacteria bacterium]